ncbi:MAG: DUF805 domain-containing protein [Sphingomonas sp.]
MDWMLLPLRKYATFSGRARRKEFWMWVLFVVLVAIVLTVLDGVLGLGGRSGIGSTATQAPGGVGYGAGAFARGGILTAIFSLAILIPNLAVSVRRLHDIDRTGWWVVLPVVPYLLGMAMIVGGAATSNLALVGGASVLMLVGVVLAIVLLVFYCMAGTRGPNRFGPDPLDPNATADVSEVFG